VIGKRNWKSFLSKPPFGPKVFNYFRLTRLDKVNNLIFHCFLTVYGTLERVKFFWPYLQDKNPFYKRHEYTPLHFAAYHGLVDVTQFMVSILGVVALWDDC
jgi:hypothetical protein